MRKIKAVSTFIAVWAYVAGALADAPVKYTVDTPADFLDGSCAANASSGGRCTLRAALAQAQLVSGESIVELLADPVVSLGEIYIAGGAAPRITIQSQIPEGRRASITGSQNSRLLRIAAGATVTLFNLSIQAFKDYWAGGALWNDGTLDIRRSMLANNTAVCSADGIQSAYASCGGGAVWNNGELTVSEGCRFEVNAVRAEAYTASIVSASAGGGAIASNGPFVIALPVAFVSNSVSANAQAGYHPYLPSSAYASAFGGAVSSSGPFAFLGGSGSCEFLSNTTQATASAMSSDASRTETAGGAISQHGSLVVPAACEFHNNVAAVDPDVHVVP